MRVKRWHGPHHSSAKWKEGSDRIIISWLGLYLVGPSSLGESRLMVESRRILPPHTYISLSPDNSDDLDYHHGKSNNSYWSWWFGSAYALKQNISKFEKFEYAEFPFFPVFAVIFGDLMLHTTPLSTWSYIFSIHVPSSGLPFLTASCQLSRWWRSLSGLVKNVWSPTAAGKRQLETLFLQNIMSYP